MTAKIAYVINSVEGGGAALPVPSIAEVLRGQGAQVRVFALTPRDGRALPAMMAAGLDPLVRHGDERDHVAALRWLMRETRGWGATHLWTSLSRATLLGLIAGPTMGLPVIAWQHAAYLKPWNLRLLRLLQRNALLWVADSRCVEQLTLDRLKVAPDRLETWPIFAADPAMPYAEAWRPGEPLRIGSLGRLHPVKGYDVLAEALASLRREGFRAEVSIEVTIAGEGAERARLEAAIRQHDLPLKLCGYVADPHAYLQGLHLYLQPSRSEGFCIGVHQALSAGLPVIASRVGEPAFSIREHETGWLSPPGETRALADALRRALASPSALARMGQQARADVLDRFSRQRFEAAGGAIWRRVSAASGTDRS
jgi:glycosyltransferase involved in cell wall biosynthesis